MLVTLVVATLFISLVTLLPLFRFSHWIIRGMDFPRLQFATFAVALLIAQFPNQKNMFQLNYKGKTNSLLFDGTHTSGKLSLKNKNQASN